MVMIKRLIFPKAGKEFDEESKLEVLRMEVMEAFRMHVKNNCKGGEGKQESNLTERQRKGV